MKTPARLRLRTYAEPNSPQRNVVNYGQNLRYTNLRGAHNHFTALRGVLGAGIRIMLDANFREIWKGEVRRTPLPRTWVNKSLCPCQHPHGRRGQTVRPPPEGQHRSDLRRDVLVHRQRPLPH